MASADVFAGGAATPGIFGAVGWRSVPGQHRDGETLLEDQALDGYCLCVDDDSYVRAVGDTGRCFGAYRCRRSTGLLAATGWSSRAPAARVQIPDNAQPL